MVAFWLPSQGSSDYGVGKQASVRNVTESNSAPLYYLVWLILSLIRRVFYANTEIHGLENMPPDGQAAIVCFNHGNSISDPIVLLTGLKRMVRFCGKDTIWSIPLISWMARMCGSVPVYRRREHGDYAASFNAETFRAVYATLGRGSCVGFAPEGVSSFRSYATKFKSGIGYIALEAVDRACEAGKVDFKVHVVPTVLAFTHREKFRSDVMVRVRPSVVVDSSWLDKDRFKTRQDAAHEIVRLVEEEIHNNIFHAPTFRLLNLSITATRLHRPLGTFMCLDAYMYLAQGWSKVLQIENDDRVSLLVERLEKYQNQLDIEKLKGERIRRITVQTNGKRPSRSLCMKIIAYRLLVGTVLLAVILPGLLVWSPIWYLIKTKEKELLCRGSGWVDSLAESKMMMGFLSLIATSIAALVLAPFYLPIILLYICLVVRLYEEAVANFRSMIGIYNLMNISQKRLDNLIHLREEARIQIIKTMELFPKITAERLLKYYGDNVYVDHSLVVTETHPWWTNLNPFKRRKKDWNELLRLSDYCTMDYVDKHA